MMDARKRNQLVQILEAQYQIAQSEYATALTQIARLETERQHLSALQITPPDLDLEDQTRQAKYRLWITQELRALGIKQAQAQATKLKCRDALQISFGRKEAFSKVLAREKRQRKIRQNSH